MKKIIHLLLFFPLLGLSQTQTENYVLTKIYKQPTATTIVSPTLLQADQTITYYDDFGKPMQTVDYAQSSSGNDLVLPYYYDQYGRQTREYLPYATTSNPSLDYKTNASSSVVSFYNTINYENTTNPYSEIKFDDSPLDRVIEKTIPGNDWNINNALKHTLRYDYQTNVATGIEAVKLYKAIATWNPTKQFFEIALSNASGTSYYQANKLFKTIVKNHDWKTTDGKNNTSEEFTDFEGKLILKRAYSDYKDITGVITESQVVHETYYVYDQFGNLSYILPPSVTDASDLEQIESLCYQYRYDNRNRLVEKKLPGKQWEFIVYDRLDREIAYGPTNSPFTDAIAPNNIGWIITKYDAFDRPIYTGWRQSNSVTSDGRAALQVAQNALTGTINELKTTSGTIDGTPVYYSNTVTPTSFKILTINYYDNYSFPNAPTSFANVEGQPVYYNNTIKPMGMQTGFWQRALESSAQVRFEKSYVLYDDKVRIIRTHTTNYIGGYTQTDSKIDFSGKVLYTVTKHKRTSSTAVPELVTKEEYTYSDQDRLLKNTHQITYNNVVKPKQLISYNSYDELGQLINQKIGGTDISATTSLQNVNYNYTIHGDLKTINDVDNLSIIGDPLDLFSFKINYNTVDNGQQNISPKYNGNISQTHWRTSNDVIKRSYGYQYDQLNRLTSAKYERPANPSNPNQSSIKDTFNESLTYDKAGNILSLVRNGGAESQTIVPIIDDLEYLYNGNRLSKVTDNSINPEGFTDGIDEKIEYDYDDNGNMIRDDNKGITSIKYNHLHLPIEIEFVGVNKKIFYTYNASGQKIKKYVTNNIDASTTEYINGFQYNNSVLQFIPTDEGYVKNTVVNNTYTFDYIYTYKDHLGNIRLCYGIDPANGQLRILEENNYYPFGLKHGNYNNALRSIEKEEETSTAGKAAIQIVQQPKMNIVSNSGFQYKYQEQERQDELALNWDSFAYRNYDYALGRFMSVDPLAEEYHHWSPYVFGGNQVVHSREIEGLEPDEDLNEKDDDSGIGVTSWSTAGFNGGAPCGVDEFSSLNENGGTFKEVVVYGTPASSNYSSGGTGGSGSESGMSVGAEIAIGFIPGSDVIGMYQGLRDGNVGLFLMSTAFVAFDVATLGTGSLVKGGLKAAIKVGAKELAEDGAEKLIKEGLTNEQLVKKAAMYAEKKIAKSGPVAGTAKHTYANNLLKRYQKIYGDKGLEFNQYFNKKTGKGFLDVVDHANKNIYDYKFGKAVMSNAQYTKYSSNFPGYSIEVIRP